jgi:hypothetical protein
LIVGARIPSTMQGLKSGLKIESERYPLELSMNAHHISSLDLVSKAYIARQRRATREGQSNTSASRRKRAIPGRNKWKRPRNIKT